MSETLRKSATDPVAQASALQHRAADPDNHVWVMASAGTGKTTVLVERFIRLVLRGVKPQRILCLTYTKAAATQMKERVLRRLSEWVCMDEGKLRNVLQTMTDAAPDDGTMARARGLFGELLDEIDTLNIMTIHAFCQSLLARFQNEAGLEGGSEPMDNAHADQLLQALLRDILQNDPAPYIERLALMTADNGWTDLVEKIVKHRSRFQDLIDHTIDARAAIYEALDVDPDGSAETLKAALIDPDTIPWTLLERIPKSQHLNTPVELQRLREAGTIEAAFDIYAHLFLTQKGEKRKHKTKDDDADAALSYEADKVLAVFERERAYATAQCSADLCELARAALSRYREAKALRGLVDYDDLIEFATRLLTDTDASAWVRFKLDGGIDHVLVDEAQDTSPLQWQIVASIVQEYFAGLGRLDPESRTLFVVGDRKQSIFGYQGADPKATEEFRSIFGRLAAEAKRPWSDVPLTTSFRTAQDILDVVDETFTRWQEPLHLAGKSRPGRVELWPVIETEDGKEKATPWTLPALRASTPQALVIEQAADRIKVILDARLALPSKDGGAITAGDVLVLVRTRNHVPRPLIKALRARGVPVAGLDRLVLTDDIAVQDMLAMLRWALFPNDDLTLAALLKSPFIGWDDDALAAVAQGRSGSLWEAVRTGADKKITAWLSAMAVRVLSEPVGRALRALIARPCPADAISGRRALQARLGPACLDAVDELLSYADARERETPGSLAFLDGIDRNPPELKREMEGTDASGVRIMTAHGAKGLEAPIVFLIDTLHTDEAIERVDTLQWLDGLPLWAPRKEDRADALETLRTQAKQAAMEEYDRLLYVAMTRAMEALIVMGGANEKSSDGSWYHSIANAMLRLSGVRDEDGARVYGGWSPQSAGIAPVSTQSEATQSFAFEDWEEPETTDTDTALSGNDRARAIGRQWHKLMERAMERDEHEIEAMMADWLDDLPDIAENRAREKLAQLRAHTVYGALFQPGGAVEVPFITMNEALPVRGRIDRLVRNADALWIIDYKSRFDPKDAAQRINYSAQLEGYKRALAPIAGQLPIRTLLVDIGAGRIEELDL